MDKRKPSELVGGLWKTFLVMLVVFLIRYATQGSL